MPQYSGNTTGTLIILQLVIFFSYKYSCSSSIFLYPMLVIDIVTYIQECTIDLIGKKNPSSRSILWKSKRVFFLTPQILQNDMKSGDYL